jgi:hypothetical protein
MTDTQDGKPGFTVRDRRGEERSEPVSSWTEEIQAAESGPAPDEQKRLAARSQGIMGPILVIECPHCKCIIKTIDEPTLEMYAKGKPFVGECQDPDCAKTFTVQRPLQPAVQRIPNPPKAIADAIRKGGLPGLPLRPR